jgi:hypothetical protein
MTLPSSSICGVTSSATPEKNDVSSIELLVDGRRRGDRVAGDIGDEELVGTGLDDGLLIVERRDPRARQHAGIALDLQQVHVGAKSLDSART